MQFKENWRRERLIECWDTRERVGAYLKGCLEVKTLELVPYSYHEDEQQTECEATFRHRQLEVYLLYARHIDQEQLDIAVPESKGIESPDVIHAMRDTLIKDGLGDLLVPEEITA